MEFLQKFILFILWCGTAPCGGCLSFSHKFWVSTPSIDVTSGIFASSKEHPGGITVGGLIRGQLTSNLAAQVEASVAHRGLKTVDCQWENGDSHKKCYNLSHIHPHREPKSYTDFEDDSLVVANAPPNDKQAEKLLYGDCLELRNVKFSTINQIGKFGENTNCLSFDFPRNAIDLTCSGKGSNHEVSLTFKDILSLGESLTHSLNPSPGRFPQSHVLTDEYKPSPLRSILKGHTHFYFNNRRVAVKPSVDFGEGTGDVIIEKDWTHPSNNQNILRSSICVKRLANGRYVNGIEMMFSFNQLSDSVSISVTPQSIDTGRDLKYSWSHNFQTGGKLGVEMTNASKLNVSLSDVCASGGQWIAKAHVPIMDLEKASFSLKREFN